VGESRERVHAALAALGLSLPPKRITVNLSPADLPKEGAHYDLPIALALLAAMGIVDRETVGDYLAVGELALDGRIIASPGVLLAALHAASCGKGLICPVAQGPEARWAPGIDVIAAPDLISLLNHLKGTQALAPPQPGQARPPSGRPTCGRSRAGNRQARARNRGGRRAQSPAGRPARRGQVADGLVPAGHPARPHAERGARSLAGGLGRGMLEDGQISRARPYRSPHHSASMAALTGGACACGPAR
jgi:magnesium chelatase family protein